MMEVAIFDIKADYGFFRTFENTRGNFSYPFPPRTSLMGLIASILGYEYNSYWNEHPLNKSMFGIEILAPIKRKGMKMNYIQSRKVLKIKEVEILIPKDPTDPDSRGFSTQVRLDLLKDIHYRIYYSNPDNELFKEVCNSLKNHLYHFPPYLGHANLLCQLDWIGKFPLKKSLSNIYTGKCLIPASIAKPTTMMTSGGYRIVLNVPMEYKSEEIEDPAGIKKIFQISPIRYENVILQEIDEGNAIKLELINTNYLFDVEFPSETHQIVFFP